MIWASSFWQGKSAICSASARDANSTWPKRLNELNGATEPCGTEHFSSRSPPLPLAKWSEIRTVRCQPGSSNQFHFYHRRGCIALSSRRFQCMPPCQGLWLRKIFNDTVQVNYFRTLRFSTLSLTRTLKLRAIVFHECTAHSYEMHLHCKHFLRIGLVGFLKVNCSNETQFP